jgi:hypothetical protein
MGYTQGLLATLVADTAPAELRGTAYRMFNLLTGLALLAASIMAGTLWDMIGSGATFLAGPSLPHSPSPASSPYGGRTPERSRDK